MHKQLRWRSLLLVCHTYIRQKLPRQGHGLALGSAVWIWISLDCFVLGFGGTGDGTLDKPSVGPLSCTPSLQPGYLFDRPRIHPELSLCLWLGNSVEKSAFPPRAARAVTGPEYRGQQ